MGSPTRKRILWLHTQPEPYHNRMMDDLARGTGYRVAGMAEEHSEEFEYIAAFGYADKANAHRAFVGQQGREIGIAISRDPGQGYFHFARS